jgi:para-aminobenzoate synthetase component 1
MKKIETIEKLNYLGKSRKPFLFLISFDLENNIILPPGEESRAGFYFSGKLYQSPSEIRNYPGGKFFRKFPVARESYSKAFSHVMDNLQYGNSYLANLTFPSAIQTDFTFDEIYEKANTGYKAMLRDKFVCFSPETFVEINRGKIKTHPMKGTISANLPNAEKIILSDKKESAEHNTIVDLLRNDLSIVAKKVRVNRFRYPTIAGNSQNPLIQISTEIEGDLPGNYHENMGTILFKMLPAGSVTGAPKQRTVEIIKAAEQYERGYYTGIAGFFDGRNLDSCVLIRFIEKNGEGLIFKSGGGITCFSDEEKEYRELCDKIYLPF